MSNLTIEVKNDAMLGRMNDKALHITLIEQQKEIERLKQKAQDDYENYQEIMSQVLEQKERLNNIINQMEQFFIDNANDEMKKCFDKLHSLKDSDKK